MPTAAEMQEINRVTSNLDPKTAAAMRILFIITEFRNEEADIYINTALQKNGKVPPRIARELMQYNLVSKDRTIPLPLQAAIKSAIKTSHLAVKTLRSPHLLPKPDFKFLLGNVVF
ncbi:MAG: hypothetical protein KDI13_11270 [Alphaproteobacteria bacterium]|nr:hypothetical protein [Alphaproteobacteria bacterium]